MGKNKKQKGRGISSQLVNPIGVHQQKDEEASSHQLIKENAKVDLAKAVSSLLEENSKLKEIQFQQQLLLEKMQLQIQELQKHCFGQAGNVWEMNDKNEDTSFAAGNMNKLAVKTTTSSVLSNTEVQIPSELNTMSNAGLCYYVLQTGTDYGSILKQINKIDSSFLRTTNLIGMTLKIKLMELIWGPTKLLNDFILPYCLGNRINTVFSEHDAIRTVWLHGPSGMGKEAWVRKEFPPEQGYLYVYSRNDMNQFKSSEHKGIVAVNFELDPVSWPAYDLRTFVGSEQTRYFNLGERGICIPYGTQRIVISRQAHSEMFHAYKFKDEDQHLQGNTWRTIAVQISRRIYP